MIEFDSVRYWYPGAETPALESISFRVPEGHRVLVAGPSGSGKSTLLRAVNGLVPHFYGGRFGGRVRVAGTDTRSASPRSLASSVGTVFQDSQARFLAASVEEEIAFSLELAEVDPGSIARRVGAIIERMGLTSLAGRATDRLSAGERARVAIAAALARDPRVLVLDEPVTHLDPAGASAVVEWVAQLRREDGLTALIAEHRHEWWDGNVERKLALSEGRMTRPREWIPGPTPGFEFSGPLPPAVLRAEGVRLRYGRTQALDGASLVLRPGELVGLIGRNGSGKTSLLRCLVGLQRPDDGEITLDGRPIAGRPRLELARRIAYVPQPPSGMLLSETVRDEVAMAVNGHGGESVGEVLRWMDAFELTAVSDRFPRDLSAGERERVALAAALVSRPSIVLLDEPTLGMDRERMMALGGILRSLCRAGGSALVATHDAGFVDAFASRAILLAGGRSAAEGRPDEVLAADPDFDRARMLWRQAAPAAFSGEEAGWHAIG